MSMNMRTFRAATADEALAQVHQELGADAVVVEIRKVALRGLFSWLARRTICEVTATRATVAPAQSSRKPRQGVPTIGTVAAAAAVRQTLESVDTDHHSPASDPSEEIIHPTVALPSVSRITASDWTDIDGASRSIESLAQRLDVLHSMIADLERRSAPGHLYEIPPELFPHYLALVESGVPDVAARELIQDVQRAAGELLCDSVATMTVLTDLLERRIRCGGNLSHSTGVRQVAVLVGPPGAGKTTTLMRLARKSAEQGLRVSLIAIDGTEPGDAVRDSMTCADRMSIVADLPLVTRTVIQPSDLQSALDGCPGADLVLIDTPGTALKNAAQIDRLREFCHVARPDHVYLVLGLTTGATTCRAHLDHCSSLGPTALVLTKLDEAPGRGPLVTIARESGLPLAYLSSGSERDDQFETANPGSASRLILGTDH